MAEYKGEKDDKENIQTNANNTPAEDFNGEEDDKENKQTNDKNTPADDFKGKKDDKENKQTNDNNTPADDFKGEKDDKKNKQSNDKNTLADDFKGEKAVEENNQQDDSSTAEEDFKGKKDDDENNQQDDSSASEDDRALAPSITQQDLFHCDQKELAKLSKRLERMSPAEMVTFMMEPLPQGVWFECDVRRIPTGMTRLSRMFRLYFKPKADQHKEWQGILLASCLKLSGNRTSHYIVTTDDSQMGSDSAFFVGKIRSNFTGSEFMAYGPGLNPKKLSTSKGSEGPLGREVREELAHIAHESCFSLSALSSFKSDLRKLKVVLPAVVKDGECAVRTPCRALAPGVDGLAALAEHHSQCSQIDGKPLVTTYVNKPAKWDKRQKGYVLDFNNRVGMRSVKNFQLVQENDHNEIYLQFGRFEKQNFHLDFRYPMSPFQALSLASPFQALFDRHKGSARLQKSELIHDVTDVYIYTNN